MPLHPLIDRLPRRIAVSSVLAAHPDEVVVRASLDGVDVVVRASARAAAGAAAELRVLRALDVPGVPALIEAGPLEVGPRDPGPIDPGRPGGGGVWVARPWVEGRDLGAAVREGRIDRADGLRRILGEVAGALAALHSAGHVHGDLSPSNVIVDDGGRAHLVDLGFAGALDAGAGGVRGTPPFIAPEVLRGAPPGPAADLFALGASMVALAADVETDVRGFYGRFPAEPFLDAIGVDPGDLPGWARGPLRALLAREPSRRPADAFALAVDLGWEPPEGPPAPPRVDVLAGRRGSIGGAWGEAGLAWVLLADEAEVEEVARALAVDAAAAGRTARYGSLGALARGARTTLDLDRAIVDLWGDGDGTGGGEGDGAVVFIAVGGPDAWALEALDAIGHAALGGGSGRTAVAVTAAAGRGAAERSGSPWRGAPQTRAPGFDVRAATAGVLRGDGDAANALLARVESLAAGSAARARSLLARAADLGAFARDGAGLTVRAAFDPAALAVRRGPGAARVESDAGRDALALLAAAGRPLPTDLLGDGLGDLVAAGLVDVAGGIARPLDALPPLAEIEPDRARRAAVHGLLAQAIAAEDGRVEVAWPHALASGVTGADDVAAEAMALARVGLHARVAAGLSRARGALEAAGRPLPPALRPHLVDALGRAGDLEGALRTARALAPGETALVALAEAHAARAAGGQRARAGERFDAAGRPGLAAAERAHAELEAGRPAEARARAEDALAGPLAGSLVEHDDDARRAAVDLIGLRAQALAATGEPAVAVAALGEAIAALDAAGEGDTPLLPALLVNRCNIARGLGPDALDGALADVERALGVHTRIGSNAGIAQAQSLLGAVRRQRGELVRAEEALSDALSRRRRMPDRVARALSRGSRGLVRAERGHVRAALDDLEAARAELEALGHRDAVARIDGALAEARWALGGVAFPGPAPTDADVALRGDLASPDSTAAGLLARAREEAARGRDRLAARAAIGARAAALDAGDSAAAEAARRVGEGALARVLDGLDPVERRRATGRLLRGDDPRPADLDAWNDDTEGDMDVMRILELNARLVDEEAPETLLSAIAAEAVEVSGAERGFIVLERGGDLVLDTAFESGTNELSEEELEWSRSVVTRALREGRTLRLADAVDDVDWGEMRSIESIGLRSILAAPFTVDDAQRGVIVVDDATRPGAFGPREERLLGLLAGQAALALRQVLRLQAIRELSRELRERFAAQSTELGDARRALEEARALSRPVTGLIGDSKRMEAVREALHTVAPAEISVLITGESGTGKDVAARAVHALSGRSDGPFVSENCAAIPASLVESELFGAAKGAFTGSDRDRKGLFERAEGGTLFLDEIGELPAEAQAKLLRILETRRVRRIGDESERPVDFRLVAATNRDLESEVTAGRFRQDLFYRLDGVRIAMPSLAERPEDIPALVRHFTVLEEARADTRLEIAPEVIRRLEDRPWPGNVRELANEVRRLVILSRGPVVDPDLVRTPERGAAVAPPDAVRTIAELERDAILDALERFDGDKRRVAEALGISRAKVYQRLKEWGLT